MAIVSSGFLTTCESFDPVPALAEDEADDEAGRSVDEEGGVKKPFAQDGNRPSELLTSNRSTGASLTE